MYAILLYVDMMHVIHFPNVAKSNNIKYHSFDAKKLC